MSVALPMIFLLHFGQTGRLSFSLFTRTYFNFCVLRDDIFVLFAALADMVTIEAVENSGWRRHLIHTNLW